MEVSCGGVVTGTHVQVVVDEVMCAGYGCINLTSTIVLLGVLTMLYQSGVGMSFHLVP